MNTDLHQASAQYVGLMDGELVCHTGIIQMPMKKGYKRVHRLVVLPDYQGIGIGTKFISEIAKIYSRQGYVFNLTTTTPALVGALKKNPNWRLARYGRVKSEMIHFDEYYGVKKAEQLERSKSNKRITYSFYYEDK